MTASPAPFPTKSSQKTTDQARVIVQLSELGDIEDIESRLQEFLAPYSTAGKVADGWEKLVEAALSLERFDTAAVFAEQQCQAEPDNTHHLYNQGLILSWAGRNTDAQDVAKRLVEAFPGEDTGYQLMLDCLQMSGDWQSMSTWWAKLASNAATRLAEHPLGKQGMRFINQNHGVLHRFGETATQLDPYVKMRELGWMTAGQDRLIAPAEIVANNCYLDYWSDYIDIIRDPEEIDQLIDLATDLRIHTRFFRTPDGQFVSKMQGQAAVQKAWQTANKSPLLKLREDHRIKGRAALEKLGLPADAWFACLHVREAGYLKPHEAELHAFRDAHIEDYLLAVEAITAKGGWVVRLGDPSMTALPPMPNVIDIVKMDDREDWLDVYLLAAAKFVLGTTSGPTPVAATFGTPVIMTNMVPHGERGPNENSLFLPKLYAGPDGQIVPFHKMLEGDIRWLWNGKILRKTGLTVVDNTPEELRDITLEMMARQDPDEENDTNDATLQDRYRALFDRDDDFDTGSQIGRAFISKYQGLL
jgi:putative glycosyltransferase (TIGR04372 family)